MNYLSGMGGNDTLHGGGGNDFVSGDDGNDVVYGDAGADTLFGGMGSDVLHGGDGDDALLGQNGNDTLDGGAADWQDIADYFEAPGAVVVNLALGVTTEDGFGGVDTLVDIEGVYGSAFNDAITGDANANFLWAAGGNDTVNGGAGNDSLEGAEGNDVLDGGAGADTMGGGTGDDLFRVDNAGDTIREAAGEGTDSVEATVSYTLAANVEHLRLLGSADLSATGNDSANRLTGNTGNNVLSGGAGSDTLDGGTGIDTAVFGVTRASATVTKTASGFDIGGGADGTDTLTGIERVRFADKSFALDLDGHAGIAARILGAVAPGDFIGAKGAGYIGFGLGQLDAGVTESQLMQVALDLVLGPNATHGAVVDLLYFNVAHAAPDAVTRAYYVGLLDDHTYTPATLGVFAAHTSYNDANIGFTGLVQTGIEYL